MFVCDKLPHTYYNKHEYEFVDLNKIEINRYPTILISSTLVNLVEVVMKEFDIDELYVDRRGGDTGIPTSSIHLSKVS